MPGIFIRKHRNEIPVFDFFTCSPGRNNICDTLPHIIILGCKRKCSDLRHLRIDLNDHLCAITQGLILNHILWIVILRSAPRVKFSDHYICGGVPCFKASLWLICDEAHRLGRPGFNVSICTPVVWTKLSAVQVSLGKRDSQEYFNVVSVISEWSRV